MGDNMNGRPGSRRGSQDGILSKEDEDDQPYDEAMANAERELAEDAEWKRIQENTFTRWTNEHLRQVDKNIIELENDFSNGLKLIALIEVLSGKKMPRHNKKPTFRSQKLENVSIALQFLENEGITLVNIDSTDIVDCKLKLIMGLIWTLILHYSISMPMYDGPELGGNLDPEKTPKQRLMGWIQNKLPGLPVTNFTKDWQDGKAVGALVDSCAPGLCPDWEDWAKDDPVRNATEAMDLADSWLGVPKLLTPEEIVNPNVDEQSMMTYLSQFPNAKLKQGAPLRSKSIASKVRAYGPGLEPTGVVANAPATFTVETFGAGDAPVNVVVIGPNKKAYECSVIFNNDRKKTYSCSYFPLVEGEYVVTIEFAGRNIPKSPYNVTVEGFAGDASLVTVSGPGVEPQGVVTSKPTEFQVFTDGAGKGNPDVIVLDPKGKKENTPVTMTPLEGGVYHCEYTPSMVGLHSVNVFFAGNPIPDSPFGVKVGPSSNPGKVWAKGRGLQPHGIRANEMVDFKVYTEGAGEGVAAVKIIEPGGSIVPTNQCKSNDPKILHFTYMPHKEGRHIIMITWSGKEIPRSPFEVNVGPQKSSKIKAFGPGLKSGVVDLPALFTVDTCGETGSLGFSIEGPSKAVINCTDNGDGSANVSYTPTCAGEYAVHILCDNEDIPGSPYMAQIVPADQYKDFAPEKVKCFGPGIEEVVTPNENTHFTIDTTGAGEAPLDVSIMDEYGERIPSKTNIDLNAQGRPPKKMIVSIVEGKNLKKADLIGKSDPYVKITYKDQVHESSVIQNSSNPVWNFEADFLILDETDQLVKVEIYDYDKIGKSTCIGTTTFDTGLVEDRETEPDWRTLDGGKNSSVLMSARISSETEVATLRQTAPNTFQCQYRPRKTLKQVVNVNYGGVAVPGSPFTVLIDDPTNPGMVQVYGPGVEPGVTAGKPTNFTIDCTEAGPGNLTVAINNNKQAVPIDIKNNGNNIFNVAYNPKKEGQHFISIHYDGRELPQSPLSIDILPGQSRTRPNAVSVTDLSPKAFVNCTNVFNVDASGTDSPQVKVDIISPDGSVLPNTTVGPVDPVTKKMKVSYIPVQEGKNLINVSCDGVDATGSPFPVNAIHGSDPSKVKAYGDGLDYGIVNEDNQFTIETINAGKGGLGLAIEGPSEAKMTCKDNRDGSCTVDYVPTVPGNYDISVKFDDDHINGSPFSVNAEERGSKHKPKGLSDENVAPGVISVNLIKARKLIKTDIIGKADPYAKISFGSQSFQTPTINNTQEPEWNYEAKFKVPEKNNGFININLFDSDMIGKDKSLGTLKLDIAHVVNNQGLQGVWYPLSGVDSGEVLLSANYSKSKSNDKNQANGNNLLNKADPTKVKAYGPGLQPDKIIPGKPTNFTIDCSQTHPDKLDVNFVDNNGVEIPKTQQLRNIDTDVYDLAYVPPSNGEPYQINVRYGDEDIPGSPFAMNSSPDINEEMDKDSRIGNQKGVDALRKKMKGANDSTDGQNDDDLGDIRNPNYTDNKPGKDHANDENFCKVVLNLIKAKDLIKADIIGKSDPYAIIKYGKQTYKTDVVKNDLNPEWNYSAEFTIPEGNEKNIIIDVYDADKFGKDKSLGSLKVNINDILNKNDTVKGWYPLTGVKSGQLLISTDCLALPKNDDEKLKKKHKRSNSSGKFDTDLADSPQSYNDKYLDDSPKNYDDKYLDDASRSNNDKYDDKRRPSFSDIRKLNVKLLKAKDLIKADIIGKSDPYAILKYGNQVFKTNVIKNNQNPEWNYEANFLIPEDDIEYMNIQLYDSDKFGKDKSLGSINMNVLDAIDSGKVPNGWYPLTGVKSGQILLESEIQELDNNDKSKLKSLDRANSKNNPRTHKNSNETGTNKQDPTDEEILKRKKEKPDDRKNSYDNDPNKLGSNMSPESPGKLNIKLIKAKDLIKKDIIGKSDPYAILMYGNQKFKTNVVKNTQNPEWNFDANFNFPQSDTDDINIQLYDSDKIGKDSSLGSVCFNVNDLINNGNVPNGWYPLNGVKSGQIYLSSEFSSAYDNTDKNRFGKQGSDNADKNRFGKQGSADISDSDVEKRKHPDIDMVRFTLIQAKDLEKSALTRTTNPYATITYGNQKVATNIVQNDQNPNWNALAELDFPDGDSKTIDVEIFDKEDITNYDGDSPYEDKPIGYCQFPVNDLIKHGEEIDGWNKLQGVRSGQIYVKTDFCNKNDEERGGMTSGNKRDTGKRYGEDTGIRSVKDRLAGNYGPNKGNNEDNRLDGKYAPGMDNIEDSRLEGKYGPNKGNNEDDTLQGKYGPNQGNNKDNGKYGPNAGNNEDNSMEGKYGPNKGKNGSDSASPYGNQKKNKGENENGNQNMSDGKIPKGNLHVEVIGARNLPKSDLIGKSDPYAVIALGPKSVKTNTIKNSQNPEWNFASDFNIDPNYTDNDLLSIDVFDKDNIGKDKLLGNIKVDLLSLINQPIAGVFPLNNTKSGEIVLSTNFTPDKSSDYNMQQGGHGVQGLHDELSYDKQTAGNDNHSLSHQKNVPHLSGKGLRDGTNYEPKHAGDDGQSYSSPKNAQQPSGKVQLCIIKAKDLISTDITGKSDPYAVITHGNQICKTDVIENTENPEWNCKIELQPDPTDKYINVQLFDHDKFGKDDLLGTYKIDINQVIDAGYVQRDWQPMEENKTGTLNMTAEWIPEMQSSLQANQYHTIQLDAIPLPSTGGKVEALVTTPTNEKQKPSIVNNSNGTVAITYQPDQEGLHYLDVKYNNDHVQGSPFRFNVTRADNGKVVASGPGLTHGVCGEPAKFAISTQGAGAGGLSLAVEGPSKAEIVCHDNKDGTVNVSYQPNAPGEYKITAKFADKHIPGSPFTAKITGEGKKRNQISVGSSSELALPGNLSESDLRSLKAYIESPSGCTEQCYLKKLPKGNIGISFTPREVGDHLVSVKRNGKHITNSPFKIVVNRQEVGDASRVQVTGEGLLNGKTHTTNRFQINTKSAGYGGLSLSIEGPSKAEIDCVDNEDGTLDVAYTPTEPGFYVINIKFADFHVPGSPYQVPISGPGTQNQTENIKHMREAVPVTQVGSQCRLTFKMPGILLKDLTAVVCAPQGNKKDAEIQEIEPGLYSVNFVPYCLGIHTVTVCYREMDIPGSPFQFTVGPLQDGGAHCVHAGGSGLEKGVSGQPSEFNVWTREAGPGSLAISVEGPSKAQIDFKDRKDGSCYVSYVVDEAGEYSVGIKFNDEHIPQSPYKVIIVPTSDHADKVQVTNLESGCVVSNTPQSFLLHKNGADGNLECAMVSPSGREDDCFISQVGQDEYSVRFVPKEEGLHHLHAKLNGVHVPGSPFKINVDNMNKASGVMVYGNGVDKVHIGEKASFIIDTTTVGAGTLSVTVDGPSKVDMDCVEVKQGYQVSYTPTVPGDYFVTVKYNGANVEGSPFNVTATGGGIVAARAKITEARRESSSFTMETIQHTAMTSQIERPLQSSIPVQPNFVSDASKVVCEGAGIEHPVLGKQNSFHVDCSRAGSNVLFVGVFGPENPCDEVYVKHQGDKQYGVKYKLKQKGQYLLYIKWGDEHIPGSPFHVQV